MRAHHIKINRNNKEQNGGASGDGGHVVEMAVAVAVAVKVAVNILILFHCYC